MILAFILSVLLVLQRLSALPKSCCNNILQEQDVDSIINCANQTSLPNQSVFGPSLSVVLVTRATKDIHSYAAYSYFLQKEYSLLNSYELLHLTPDSLSLDYKYHRKLVPLLEAMESRPFADYYVWMDADLIVLDFKLRLESIASQNDKAHILMSRDVSNLANTGCIIVKNSQWSKGFLTEWLSLKSNPHILNEQIGFDHLYQLFKDRDKQQSTKHLQKIALLSPETLNSIFPAMREQLPHHKILHMATDSTLYRQTVFRTAAMNYCTALRDSAEIPQQLGITRSFLQKTVLTINKASYVEIERTLASAEPQHDADSGINDLLLSYRDSVSKYCFAVSYQNHNQETTETLSLRKHSFRVVQNTVDIRLKYIINYMERYEIGNAGLNEVSEAGVAGMGSKNSALYSVLLNELLPAALKEFLRHVESVQQSRIVTGLQLVDLKAASVTAEVLPDMMKAGVELAFELLQSIAKMGDRYSVYGYTITMIREEQTFLLEYILHGLDTMLILVHPKMIPSVEAMKNDFLVKCGDYCKNR